MCLIGLIGLDTGSLVITELPGINLNNITMIADGQESAQEIFNICEKRAIQSFKSAFSARVNECYLISDLDTIDCLICANKEKLAFSLWYLIGAEIMTERVFSDRLNRFTTIDRKKAGETKDYFMLKFNEQLDLAVKAIDITVCVPCVEHNEIITTITSKP